MVLIGNNRILMETAYVLTRTAGTGGRPGLFMPPRGEGGCPVNLPTGLSAGAGRDSGIMDIPGPGGGGGFR